MEAWSSIQDEFLRENWDRFSASTIAADPRINKSRNAVIGRAYRMGLSKKRVSVRKSTVKRALTRKSSTEQLPAQLLDKSAGAIPASATGAPVVGSARHEESAAPISLRRSSPPLPATNAEAVQVNPHVPAAPAPFTEATGCLWSTGPTFLEPGEHMDMLCCNEPRDGTTRYCAFHRMYQRQDAFKSVPMQEPFQ